MTKLQSPSFEKQCLNMLDRERNNDYSEKFINFIYESIENDCRQRSLTVSKVSLNFFKFLALDEVQL